MEGGGGVNGYIHNVAGPDLLRECISLGGCEFGEAKLTKGYKLPAKFIIHTVGPSKNNKNPDLLKKCYVNSLNLAKENHIRSLAFPCISTGNYEFPPTEAAKIALNAVRLWLSTSSNADHVKTRNTNFCNCINSRWIG